KYSLKGSNFADMAVHNGFLYTTSLRENDIEIFDTSTGDKVGEESIRDANPIRGLHVSANGQFLFVHYRGGAWIVYDIESNGTVTPLGEHVVTASRVTGIADAAGTHFAGWSVLSSHDGIRAVAPQGVKHTFIRGDVDNSGTVSITDAIRILEALFLGGSVV